MPLRRWRAFPLRGTHPVAWQSQFHGCAEMAAVAVLAIALPRYLEIQSHSYFDSQSRLMDRRIRLISFITTA
ncbi:hypothetical protein A1D30_03255 [Acidovorax sp. GW101-3H11]|nr:hypothetical protein A1D30_03255 [Acidovorax sp. GW101-3H11]